MKNKIHLKIMKHLKEIEKILTEDVKIMDNDFFESLLEINDFVTHLFQYSSESIAVVYSEKLIEDKLINNLLEYIAITFNDKLNSIGGLGAVCVVLSRLTGKYLEKLYSEFLDDKNTLH